MKSVLCANKGIFGKSQKRLSKYNTSEAKIPLLIVVHNY